jgi:spore coat protein CotF
MKLIAEKNQFAGYKLNGMVDRTNFRLRFKYANEIEEEDKILLDLSSENPALKATLKAAATRYIEMNEAISSYVLLTSCSLASF